MEAQLQKQFTHWQESLDTFLQKLEGFTHQQLNTPPAPGKWSANQALYHTMDAERKSLMYLQKKMQHFKPEENEKSGVKEALKSIALTAFLRSPLKVKAPPSVAEVPEEIEINQLKDDWHTTREAYRTFLEALPEEALKYSIYKHPRAGRINIYQALNFFQSHFDRHKKQAYDAVSL